MTLVRTCWPSLFFSQYNFGSSAFQILFFYMAKITEMYSDEEPLAESHYVLFKISMQWDTVHT